MFQIRIKKKNKLKMIKTERQAVNFLTRATTQDFVTDQSYGPILAQTGRK